MSNEHSSGESLELAFEWVKGVLYDQRQVAGEYNARIATFFTIDTLVMGIGLPIALSAFGQAFHPGWTVTFVLGSVAVFAYLLAALAAVYGFWPRPFNTLDDPAGIKDEFADLSHEAFQREILKHMQDAYKANNKT